jgi:hypothetical protein
MGMSRLMKSWKQYFDEQKTSFRCVMVTCLEINAPKSPHYLDPISVQDLDAALYLVLQQLWSDYSEPDLSGGSNSVGAAIAAALATYGDIEKVDYVLANLPDEPITVTTRWPGCRLRTIATIAGLLPLPDGFPDYRDWIKGSSESVKVQNWMDIHRCQLVWDIDVERFVISSNVEE